MKKKSDFKKVFVRVLVAIVGIAVILFVGLQIMLKEFSNEISKVEIGNLDLSSKADGVYEGVFDFNEAVGARVKVMIENNKIMRIEILEHRTGLGGKAEAILDKVIDAQSLNVDAISGATGSSKIILKAIENSLNN